MMRDDAIAVIRRLEKAISTIFKKTFFVMAARGHSEQMHAIRAQMAIRIFVVRHLLKRVYGLTVEADEHSVAVFGGYSLPSTQDPGGDRIFQNLPLSLSVVDSMICVAIQCRTSVSSSNVSNFRKTSCQTSSTITERFNR